MSRSIHRTVLLKETIEGLLAPRKAGKAAPRVLDCTFGGGGHSLEICKNFPDARIVALDQDKGAWTRAGEKFTGLACTIEFKNTNFRNIGNLKENSFDAVIFDLGLSSDQLNPPDGGGRGFSFLRDEPLLMTYKADPTPEDLTAQDIVNEWGEQSIADILYGYGEERFARRIAKAIVSAREEQEIQTTFELVKIVEGALPARLRKASARQGRVHCATKTFQALRIAVNDELGALAEGLEQGFQKLVPGGRMAVISFHSLEDRIVKNFYRKIKEQGKGVIVNKKPIRPSAEEIKENPRSRSAKLRIMEKITKSNETSKYKPL